MSEHEQFPTLEAAVNVAKERNVPLPVDIDGELIVVHPDGTVVSDSGTLTPEPSNAATLPDIAKGVGNIRHNFDGDARQKWRLAALCTNGQSMSFDDLHGEPFAVKYWYVHKTEVRKRDSNEMVLCDRVVLLSDDFRSVQFTSRGILDSLMQMVDCMGEGPYDPAELVQFRKIKTPAGSTYSMEPVEAEDQNVPA